MRADADGSVLEEPVREDNFGLAGVRAEKSAYNNGRKAMVSRRMFLQSAAATAVAAASRVPAAGPRMRPASQMPRSRSARPSLTADPLRAMARSPGPRPLISR